MEESKDKFHTKVRVLKSIHILKKFFGSRNETYFPASKLLKAVLYHKPPLDLIKSILYLDSYASHPRLNSRTKNETTALQIAIQNEASVAVIDELIKVNPYSIFVRNHKNDPLTCARIWRKDDAELIESLQRAIQLWNVFDHDENSIIIDQCIEEKGRNSLSSEETSMFLEKHQYFTLNEDNSVRESTEIVDRRTSIHEIHSMQQNVASWAMEHISTSILLEIEQSSRKKDDVMFRNSERTVKLHSKVSIFLWSTKGKRKVYVLRSSE